MIERYLYRGKRIIDGEWINGHYCLDDFDKPSIIALRYNGYKMYDEVVPATLGQCTGLRDKNGTLIFEGDMLRVTNWRRIGAVTFCRAMFKFDNVSLCTFFGDKDYSVEVVGNIHDNADLLEAGKASG